MTKFENSYDNLWSRFNVFVSTTFVWLVFFLWSLLIFTSYSKCLERTTVNINIKNNTFQNFIFQNTQSNVLLMFCFYKKKLNITSSAAKKCFPFQFQYNCIMTSHYLNTFCLIEYMHDFFPATFVQVFQYNYIWKNRVY
jgi:hypothetical protein